MLRVLRPLSKYPVVLSAILAGTVLAGACSRGENRLPADGAQDGEWRLAPEPIADLGELETSDFTAWAGYDQVAALSNGRTVVVDEGTQQLRILDTGGELVREVGRRGSGPGEFNSVVWVGVLPGDSILAYEVSYSNFQLFSADGDFVRAVPRSATREIGQPRPIAVLRDGSILLLQLGSLDSTPQSGLITDTSALYRFDIQHNTVTRIGAFPLWRRYAPDAARGGLTSAQPFTPVAQFDVTDEGFLYGFGEEPRVHRFAADGSAVDTIALSLDQVALHPADADSARATLGKTRDPSWKAAAARTAVEMPMPTHYPYFTDLAAAPDGDVWVRPQPARGAATVSWLVVDPAGVVTARVRLPVQFKPIRVDAATVLGRFIDEWDVQHVGIYRLIK